MVYAYQGEGALDYFPCRYGTSKLLFRGPRRSLEPPYIAVLGGTETYGKFVPHPYPALVERATGLRLVNLGAVNAGLDVYLNDPEILGITSAAHLTVVQIVGAQNLSNRFYAVHPRRNDRFLGATPVLKSLYREVDFTEFNFTRHMVQSLQRVSAERFEIVAQELRNSWVSRMAALLERIGGKTLLLWIGAAAPAPVLGPADLGRDPLLVDAAMVAAVKSRATAYLEVLYPPVSDPPVGEGLRYATLDAPAAEGVPGAGVHETIAAALAQTLAKLLG